MQPLHEHQSGEDASMESKQVMLMAEAKDTFETLKKACLQAPVLAFANFDEPFLLETDTSKLGLGAVLSLQRRPGPARPTSQSRRISCSQKQSPSVRP